MLDYLDRLSVITRILKRWKREAEDKRDLKMVTAGFENG